MAFFNRRRSLSQSLPVDCFQIITGPLNVRENLFLLLIRKIEFGGEMSRHSLGEAFRARRLPLFLTHRFDDDQRTRERPGTENDEKSKERLDVERMIHGNRDK